MDKADIKILELLRILKMLRKVKTDVEFCDNIGLKTAKYPQCIRKGVAHFTNGTHHNICKVYNIDANLIFSTRRMKIKG
jgi:hypothetical protein